jgi:hypothetical protein
MTTKFQYYTKTQGNKEVLLFDKLFKDVRGDYYLVEVNVVDGWMTQNNNYKFSTLKEATKKYNSIVKRVKK